MDLNLAGKKILVTGGSRGIGLAITQAFLEEGADVLVAARDVRRLEEVAGTLTQIYGKGRVIPVATDFTQPLLVENLVQKISQSWGKLDVLVANVGDGRSVPDPLPGAQQFSQTWNTNFQSAELIVRAALPMLEVARGSIIVVSSIAGLESIGAPTDYSVSKAALIALAKNLARKLAPAVRVNAIAPGNVYFEGGSWHEKIQANPEKVQAMLQNLVPMKRFGKPEEIANAVVFLASDRASFITGACLTVDGGQTVRLL